MTEISDFVYSDEISSWGYVSLAPFRSVFERGGHSNRSLARLMDCDESYIRKLMGRTPRHNVHVSKRTGETKSYIKYQKEVSYATACRLAKALNLDPHEVGL